MERNPKYLSDYTDILRDLGPTVFQVEFRSSMLVGTGLVGKVMEREGGSSRRTLGTEQSEELALAQALMGRVWPIRKDLAAPPGPMITLGQSFENDITIAEYTLSTHHCGFTFDVTRIMVTDLDSLNGTILNEKRLKPNEPKPVKSGDRLALGRLRFDYMTGRGFFERIYKMVHGPEAEPPDPEAD